MMEKKGVWKSLCKEQKVPAFSIFLPGEIWSGEEWAVCSLEDVEKYVYIEGGYLLHNGRVWTIEEKWKIDPE